MKDYKTKEMYFYYGKYTSGGWCKIIQTGFESREEALEYAKRNKFAGDTQIRKESVLID